MKNSEQPIFISSTLKTTASENLVTESELKLQDSDQSIENLINNETTKKTSQQSN
jgi:hypothetical protein